MKFLKTFLLCTLFFSTSCTSQESEEDIIFKYNAHTRGNIISIEATSEFIKKIENNVETTSETANTSWNEITILMKKLNLEEINTLKPPSEKRLHDGALHATLTINVGKKSYSTQTFDHGNPPKELKSITEKLLSIK